MKKESNPIPPSDYARLISLLEGTLSESEFKNLDQDLRNDPKLRAAWIELQHQESELRRHFTRPGIRIAESSSKMVAFWPTLAMAACFLIVGLLARPFFYENTELQSEIPSNAVKLVTSLDGLALNPDGETVRLDPGLEPGMLKVLEGKMELVLLSGAKVAIEGPAQIQILSDRAAYLNRGEDSSLASADQSGFTLSTRDSPKVDLGSEFAVHVDDKGSSQFRVFANDLEEPKHACPKPYHGPCPICEF